MGLRMTRVDPERNMARFYEIDLQPTLFGEFTVERHWGRIGASGQSLTFWFSNESEASAHAEKIERVKRVRGYASPSHGSFVQVT